MSKWKITLGTQDGRQMSVITDDPDEVRRLENLPFQGGQVDRATATPVNDEDDR